MTPRADADTMTGSEPQRATQASDRSAAVAGIISPVALQSRAVLVASGGLFVAACASLWNYLGALLHRNALAYSHAFFGEDILPTYNAARQILAGHGASMYDPAVVHGYTYSPVFAVLFIPLALLPWSAAQMVWYGLCQVWLWLAIGALAHLLSLALPDELSAWRVWRIPVVPALAAIWLGLAPSVQAELDFGQVDYLILALMALGVISLLEEHDARGAVFLCLAALLKITPLGLAALFLLSRRWRGLVAFGLTLAVSILVTAAIPAIGLRTWVAMRAGVDANLVFIFDQYANESIGSLAAHALSLAHVGVGPHAGEYLGLAAAACLFAPVAYIAWRWPRRTDVRFGVVVAAGTGAILLSSPLNWDHSFVVACVPAAALLAYVAREYMATGVVRGRHVGGLICAAVIASWPSTAGLMADPQAGTVHRLGDLALLMARPLALVAIICLLVWYLLQEVARSRQTTKEDDRPLSSTQFGSAR